MTHHSKTTVAMLEVRQTWETENQNAFKQRMIWSDLSVGR